MNKENLFKKIKWIDVVFPLIITIILCAPLYLNLVYEAYDFPFHCTRIVGIAKGLQSHNFPVYIYPYTNNGFGYGSPLFYCDIFLLLPAVLYLLNIPIVVCAKIYIFIFTLLMSYITYYVSRKIFNDLKTSIISTILYCFSNIVFIYYFITCGFGNIGALAFLPLLLLSWYRYFINKDNNSWILMGVSFGLLLLNHVLSFVIGVIFFSLFLIIDIKSLNKERILSLIKATLLAIGITAFFLFPMIEQLLSQEFWVSNLSDTTNKTYFTISQIDGFSTLFTDSIFILLLSDISNISCRYIGSLLSLGTSLLFILNKVINKKSNRTINILFIILIVGIFIQWDIVPLDKLTFLYNMQFIWRINVYLIPFSIYIFCYLLKQFNLNNNKILIIVICIYYSLNFVALNLSMDKTITRNLDNNTTYEEMIKEGQIYLNETNGYNILEIGQGEYLPMTNRYNYHDASTNILLPNDDEAVKEYDRVGTTITFTSDYPYAEYLYLPLSWYKGYYYQELDSDGNILYEKECGYNEYTKRVEVYKEEGSHTFKVYYKGTIIQKVSIGISILTIIGLSIYLKKKNNA